MTTPTTEDPLQPLRFLRDARLILYFFVIVAGFCQAGLPLLVALLLGLVTAGIPLVNSILAFWGAMKGWGLHWFWAIIISIGPVALPWALIFLWANSSDIDTEE